MRTVVEADRTASMPLLQELTKQRFAASLVVQTCGGGRGGGGEELKKCRPVKPARLSGWFGGDMSRNAWHGWGGWRHRQNCLIRLRRLRPRVNSSSSSRTDLDGGSLFATMLHRENRREESCSWYGLISNSQRILDLLFLMLFCFNPYTNTKSELNILSFMVVLISVYSQNWHSVITSVLTSSSLTVANSFTKFLNLSLFIAI